MVKIKSFSVGNGDMFYIKHASSNFTVIDCNLLGDRKKEIMDEICRESENKKISRFISTHPDRDHIEGIEYFDSRKEIINFYYVKNSIVKKPTFESFEKYCELKTLDKAFGIEKGFSNRWLNESGDGNDSSGIEFLWPDLNNESFKEALADANADGDKDNNISPIIKYSLNNGIVIMWFGDMKTEYMESIKDEVNFEEADVIFAPHHGRESGTIPKDILDKIKPQVIIIGEAEYNQLNYYSKYNTITQNSAKDITMICRAGEVDFFSSNKEYGIREFLEDNNVEDLIGNYYIGTLKTR